MIYFPSYFNWNPFFFYVLQAVIHQRLVHLCDVVYDVGSNPTNPNIRLNEINSHMLIGKLVAFQAIFIGSNPIDCRISV